MTNTKSEFGTVRDPRLEKDEFHLYGWVNGTDGRRIGRQNSNRATRDDAPSEVEHEQLTLSGGDD